MASRKNKGRTATPLSKTQSQPIRQTRTGQANSAFAAQNPTQQYSRNNSQYSVSSQKSGKRGKKIAIGVLCTLFVVLLSGGTAFALYVNSINDALNGNKTAEERQAIADTLAPVHNYSEPFYMLLIGSDKREGSEEDGQRSDTNILVRVDPKECVVTLVSIPRDTKIEIDGYGTNKFNAAYNYGGAASTINEANQLCGVKISHYAEVNFEELIGLVDAIGGVEVDVPELIDDPDAGNVVIQPGLQHLDGESALVFARSRSYADGDFTRTSNQRLLIEAIINKVMSMPITDLPGAIQAAAKCVTTDFTVNNLIDLAMQFKDLGDLTMYSAMVPSTTADIGGVSYVITDKTALKEMMKLVEAGEDPSTIVAENTGEYDTGSSGYGGSGGYGGYVDNSTTYTEPNYNYSYDPGYSYETTPQTQTPPANTTTPPVEETPAPVEPVQPPSGGEGESG